MWSQRQAEDDCACVLVGEVEPVAQKNAMEIFMTGLENLQKEPMGYSAAFAALFQRAAAARYPRRGHADGTGDAGGAPPRRQSPLMPAGSASPPRPPSPPRCPFLLMAGWLRRPRPAGSSRAAPNR